MARDVNIRVRVDDREIQRLRSAVRRLRAMVAATGGFGPASTGSNLAAGAAAGALASGASGTSGTSRLLGGSKVSISTAKQLRHLIPGNQGAADWIDSWTPIERGIHNWAAGEDTVYMRGRRALVDADMNQRGYSVIRGQVQSQNLKSSVRQSIIRSAAEEAYIESTGPFAGGDNIMRPMGPIRKAKAMRGQPIDTISPMYRTAGNIGQVSSSPHTIITDQVTGQDARIPKYVWTDPLQETTTIAGNRQPIRGALRSATGPVSSTLGAALGRTVAVAGAQGNIPREGLNQAVEEFRGTFKPFTDRAKSMWKTFFSKPTGSFNPFGFDKIAEKFDQIGGIASAGALLATSKKFADERSSYFKNLLTTDNAVPSSSILQQQINASVTAASDLMANFTYTSMFEVPSMFLSLGNSAFNSGDKSYEMALDMVGMQWKETLGLNEDGYKQVFGAQQQWAAAWSQQEEALNRAADQNSAALTDSLQGMGLSGISTRDFQEKFRKPLFNRSVQKARREFELENPYPTAKDVNPYGVDGLSKRDVRLWADGLNPLTDF